MKLISEEFSKKLILWYLNNKRTLPWRKTKESYFIWLSEVILQQTRVDQGMPYYERFVRSYPTVFHLAKAEEQAVLKLWQGLGYYSRARNLLHTAKVVVQEHNGIFPNAYRELIKLKGIGDYTASAIASICFDEAVAVVDGNVYRVLSRIFGIDTPVNTTHGQKTFKSLATELLDSAQPGTFNQALMEFGAVFCKPVNPDCQACVFKTQCVAFKTDEVGKFPVKHKPKPVQKRYFNYLIIKSAEGTFYMQKRENGIWKALWEFALVETDKLVSAKKLAAQQSFIFFKKQFAIDDLYLLFSETIVHKLSHQHIHTRFWMVEASENTEEFFSYQEVLALPMPQLISRFLQLHSKKIN